MELKEHINEVRGKLRTGGFPNEAAVSNGVVIRLLQALGWPVFETMTVWPEFQVEGGRVDWALCQNGRPVVFIEVKAVGRCADADRQLFEYAFKRGVPLAILTDGQEWHFYLPAEEGHFEDRKVYKLDLVEMEAAECENRLSRYLSYQRTCSGEALKSAREDHKNLATNREIERAIPAAWQKLMEEQDSLLVELLADKVEDICGYKPGLDKVADFLSMQMCPVQPERPPAPPRGPERGRAIINLQGVANLAGYADVLHGQKVEGRNAKDLFIKVMEHLSREDASFFERFAARPRHGARRRFVARTKEDLYPGRPDLCRGNSYQSKSGWWVGTHYSRNSIEKILRMACEVAGIKFGSDLVVNLGD